MSSENRVYERCSLDHIQAKVGYRLCLTWFGIDPLTGCGMQGYVVCPYEHGIVHDGCCMGIEDETNLCSCAGGERACDPHAPATI